MKARRYDQLGKGNQPQRYMFKWLFKRSNSTLNKSL